MNWLWPRRWTRFTNPRAAEPDTDQASLIDVRIDPTSEGTCATVTHRGFERHGEGARTMKDGMIDLGR